MKTSLLIFSAFLFSQGLDAAERGIDFSDPQVQEIVHQVVHKKILPLTKHIQLKDLESLGLTEVELKIFKDYAAKYKITRLSQIEYKKGQLLFSYGGKTSILNVGSLAPLSFYLNGKKLEGNEDIENLTPDDFDFSYPKSSLFNLFIFAEAFAEDLASPEQKLSAWTYSVVQVKMWKLEYIGSSDIPNLLTKYKCKSYSNLPPSNMKEMRENLIQPTRVGSWEVNGETRFFKGVIEELEFPNAVLSDARFCKTRTTLCDQIGDLKSCLENILSAGAKFYKDLQLTEKNGKWEMRAPERRGVHHRDLEKVSTKPSPSSGGLHNN